MITANARSSSNAKATSSPRRVANGLWAGARLITVTPEAPDPVLDWYRYHGQGD